MTVPRNAKARPITSGQSPGRALITAPSASVTPSLVRVGGPPGIARHAVEPQRDRAGRGVEGASLSLPYSALRFASSRVNNLKNLV